MGVGAYTRIVHVGVRLLIHVEEEQQCSWKKHEDEELHKHTDSDFLSANIHAQQTNRQRCYNGPESCTRKLARMADSRQLQPSATLATLAGCAQPAACSVRYECPVTCLQ